MNNANASSASPTDPARATNLRNPADAPRVLEPATHLYLIRHGQSNVNVTPIVGGMIGDKGLTELGVRQAEKLRDRLAMTREIKANVLIASTLPRARQTAEILQPVFGVPILFDDDVQEVRLGVGDGMPLAEFKAKYGWADFEMEPYARIAPESESLADFVVRVSSALERITTEHAGKNIVVVCHGGVVDSSFYYFFGIPLLAASKTGFNTHNTSITHWQKLPIRGRMRWELESYNDDEHLIEVGQGVALDWSAVEPAPTVVEDGRKPANPVS